MEQQHVEIDIWMIDSDKISIEKLLRLSLMSIEEQIIIDYNEIDN